MTAPDATPAIAVVIPHYNDTARLARCLDALAAQGPPPDVEIVVADNGSDRDVAGVVARYAGVRLVVETARGAAAARNRGVAETTAPRLFFVDADCVPAPDWIEAGRAALEGRDVVGGRVTTFDETPPPRSGAEALEAVLAFDFRRYIERDGFTGAGNMLTWRTIFEEVGGFRGTVSEDIDWSRRARACGHAIVYRPEVVVSHPTRADWPALRRKWVRITREMFALGAGRPHHRLRWALRAVAVLGSPVRDVPRLAAAPQLSGAGERMRAIATLLRLRTLRAGWMLRQSLGLRVG